MCSASPPVPDPAAPLSSLQSIHKDQLCVGQETENHLALGAWLSHGPQERRWALSEPFWLALGLETLFGDGFGDVMTWLIAQTLNKTSPSIRTPTAPMRTRLIAQSFNNSLITQEASSPRPAAAHVGGHCDCPIVRQAALRGAAALGMTVKMADTGVYSALGTLMDGLFS
uniref:Uncharacterized protein n=1 Tax=Knipowitschia caucasica TaxID=637954 RepID=A0AAV2J5J1_KNICA